MDDLQKDCNASNEALKSKGKEHKETKSKLEKQLHLLETRNNNLEEYKTNKVAE